MPRKPWCHKRINDEFVDLPAVSSNFTSFFFFSGFTMSSSTSSDLAFIGIEDRSAILDRILNSLPQAVFWKDSQSVYLGCNQAFANAAGLANPDEIIGKTDFELPWKDQAEGLRRDDREVIRTGQTKSHIIEQLLLVDGRMVWVETTKIPLFAEVGAVSGVLGVYQDITERKHAEEALRESEERFSQAFLLNPDSININRLSDGIYLDVNDGFLEITGHKREEVIGRSSLPGDLGIWVNKEDRDRLVECLTIRGECIGLEAPFRHKSGRIIQGLMSARLIQLKGEPCVLSITRDITERKQLEAELRQSQKMEAIGRLAGGVSHDFNNILAVFMLTLDQLRSDSSLSNEAMELMTELESSARRASDLTRQLLQFSRKHIIQTVAVDLNEIVASLLKMVVRLIGEPIQVTFQRSAEPLLAEVDPSMIDQVILNLCVNARDAMPHGGMVTLKTSRAQLTPEFAAVIPEARRGLFALISVTDTGCGMDKETLAHAFEPFFTTKAVGKGTGMGLASVHGIVKQHQGWIAVKSEVGSGSCFSVYLPMEPDKR